MIHHDSELTQKRILQFWAPLAATWLMMALEGPILTSFIARLADSTLNLAAYGVAHPLAMLIESPIIMMLSASIALVKDVESLKKLQRFSLVLNACVTAGMALIIVPPIFYFLADKVLFLPAEIAWRAHIAMMILLPSPADKPAAPTITPSTFIVLSTKAVNNIENNRAIVPIATLFV